MPMVIIKNILALLLFFTSVSVQANKEIKVEHIIGKAFVENDVSPNKARKEALNNAKIEALKKAGIGESVRAQSLLFTSETNGDFKDFFSSSSQIEIKGAVKEYAITSERMFCKDSLLVIYEVIINATVIKYNKKADPAFTSNIQGIKQVYASNSNLQFTLKSTQNCYLTIFNITDTEAYMLYPNTYENEIKLEGLKEYNFPTGKLDYTLSNETEQPETNRLIFVFTKKSIPFIKMNNEQVTSVEDVFSWIYSISPDQRVSDYHSYFITK